MVLELKDFINYYMATGHFTVGQQNGLRRTLGTYTQKLAAERGCAETPELQQEVFQMYLKGRAAFRAGDRKVKVAKIAKERTPTLSMVYATEIYTACIEKGLRPSTIASYLISLARKKNRLDNVDRLM